jgi:hypothetical protein
VLSGSVGGPATSLVERQPGATDSQR